jgi:valyl-tRNA synthetase
MQQKLKEGNLDPRELVKASEGQAKDFPQGIPECGVDAMRFALCNFSTQGRDINLDVLRIHGYRRFCNKIWQAVRLTLQKLGDDYVVPVDVDPLAAHPAISAELAIIHGWILSRLAKTVAAVNAGFRAYQFPDLTSAIHSFILYDFCDFYLELIKPFFPLDAAAAAAVPAADQAAVRHVLHVCADTFLRLLSPLMPYLTEELWQALPKAPGEAPSICVAYFPVKDTWSSDAAEERFRPVKDLIVHIRSVAAEGNLDVHSPEAFVATGDSIVRADFTAMTRSVQTLAKVKSLTVLATLDTAPKSCLTDARGDVVVALNVEGLLDPRAELVRLQEKAEKLVARLAEHDKKAAHESWARRPEHLRHEEEARAEENRTVLAATTRSIALFQSLVQ